ncbi:hypothetical protein E3Q16_04370 [Wallemia mellicola]|uniref:Uncharacterized protein n=1 Tax=Wallemia mellicola TaxID=1708541 RepID=A0AB74K7N5_9BASI|nr:hypothetical protein E3Q16_04370 [Wallemia mellicola]TIC57563.1 hypothetical protein E3Q03_04435 [Wallemia mellicola]
MEIKQNEDVDSKTNTTKTAYSHAEIIKAQKIFNKRNKSLWNKSTLSISTNIFNSIDIDYDTRIANDVYKSICKIFEPEESLEQLQTEFLSRTLIYGENAQKFYTNLKKLFTKLQKLDSIFGENSLKYRALQTIPIELKSSKLHFYQKSQYLNYDELTKAIIKDYNDTIKLDPPAKAASINQVTQIEHVDKYDDQNTSKNQSQTTDLLRRLDIKFCSYCLVKRHKSPQTHTDNEFERQRSINTPETKLSSQPQLSPANYRTLMTGRFPPDTAFFDQGSDVTCSCRLDLLTNIRQLNVPERFGTLSGESNSSLVGTMQLNLGHKNGTINWIETEAYYSPHYNSTILSKRLLEKYKLYLYYKPPYIKLPIPHYRHDTHTEESVVQTSPNANTDDTPAPASFKTIYDRFDKQEEFPNEYLGFNHSSKCKAPPTRVKGTLIQPGQAKHAARVFKQQEDDRLSKAEDTKTGIHYDHFQEQWSQFNDDKKRIYPDPEFYLPPPGAQVRESNSYKESIKELW